MPKSQSSVIDSLVTTFERELGRMVSQARNGTTAVLADRLSVTDGVIAKTKSNQRVLQSVDDVFQRELYRAGYRGLVNAFVDKFNGQFEFFQQTLDRLGEAIGRDLTLTWGKRDLMLLQQQQVSTVKMLDSVVDIVAANAERSAMFAVGGMKRVDLIRSIAIKLDDTIPRAVTIADTSLSTYYRTISDRGYRIVEKDMPQSMSMLYKYGGPSDKLTRPVCRKWLELTAGGKRWTRDEINDLENGQLDNVFLTCGGYNCRHQWIAEIRIKE
jgi:hypothetical protein